MQLSVSHTLTLALSLALTTQYVAAVQITALRVPEEVRNGSDGAILDCEYTLRQSELGPESGLVVKWFWNNSPAPVYQWIPGQRPQDLGVLKGRLKLDYKASRHPYTMHRALYINNPTTELSGEYKCSVSTFTDEDFMIKKMIVYAPERKVDLGHSKHDLHNVNITCRALGLYPEPRMTIHKGTDLKSLEEMEGVSVRTLPREESYDVVASVLLSDSELRGSLVVNCELWIPSTSYRRQKTLHYYPDSGSSPIRVAAVVLWSSLLCSLQLHHYH
ncbi:uncharacterized protein LOC128987299 isoform X2 [Macrosteles quadrilineatus]|uniref:uncharacterized protein LOC128987299 isoform X2 n=1 Tax=Macrosteles quadrilineatus TaxID=74068 RepID=UPI0023E21558|nr:uncharacterized protein LOC128987299 isoform X2 [Macrosteles quadrilineatus]